MSILLLNEDEFTPKQISGLMAWFDAKPLYLNLDSNSYVSKWFDLSGNNFHLNQLIADNQPRLVDGSVVFDGSNDYLKSNEFTAISQPFTVLIVCKIINYVVNRSVYDGNAYASNTLYMQPSANYLRLYAGPTGSTVEADAGTNKVVIKTVTNGSSSSIQINNNSVITGILGSNLLRGITLGSRGDGSLNGNVAIDGFMLFNKVLSAAEEQKLKSYCSKRYRFSL